MLLIILDINNLYVYNIFVLKICSVRLLRDYISLFELVGNIKSTKVEYSKGLHLGRRDLDKLKPTR